MDETPANKKKTKNKKKENPKKNKTLRDNDKHQLPVKSSSAKPKSPQKKDSPRSHGAKQATTAAAAIQKFNKKIQISRLKNLQIKKVKNKKKSQKCLGVVTAIVRWLIAFASV